MSTFRDIPILGDLDLAYGVPLLLIIIVLWQGIGSYLGNYFLSRVSLGLVHDLRVALFDSLLRLPNAYFDQNSLHSISRITYNVTMVTGAATDAIKVIIREGLDYRLPVRLPAVDELETDAGDEVAILPVIGLMVGNASRKFRKQSKKIQVAMGDLTHIASEMIQGGAQFRRRER